MTTPILYIGNKNYSSWSMRPWLALTWGEILFEERIIPLGGPGYGKSKIADILAVSASGRVPALHDGALKIHDSLAICEWAAERAPDLWPRAADARALARSAAAEMHSGFAAMRGAMSMNLRRRMAQPPVWSEDVRGDLTRLFELWSGVLAQSGGPYLFGARTIADAMYAPMATRLRTYNVAAPGACAAYCETILADDAFKTWEAAGLQETWTIASTDSLYP